MRDSLQIVASVTIAVLCWWAFGFAAVPVQEFPATDLPPVAVDPIVVKLVDVNECATGWARVSLDDGWVIPYPHPKGFWMPNWIDDAGIVAAFTRPDGRVAVDEMEATKAALRPAHRIICRWAPLLAKASAAD